jgi:hypothetical protein
MFYIIFGKKVWYWVIFITLLIKFSNVIHLASKPIGIFLAHDHKVSQSGFVVSSDEVSTRKGFEVGD